VDEICQWARGQKETYGITVHERRFPAVSGGKVRLADVQDAANELVALPLDVLLIYLSGHGIVKTGDDEHLLLSNVTTQPQQAISVQATISAAWLCGAPYVIVISDACRSPAIASSLVGGVVGAPILFRSPTAVARAQAVDVFYAAGPMAPAYEVNGDGLLSKELDNLLSQPPAQVVRSITVHGTRVNVIRPGEIESLLAEAVEERALTLTPPVSLQPDFRITSAVRQSLFMSLTDVSPPLASAPAPSGAVMLESTLEFDTATNEAALAEDWVLEGADPDAPQCVPFSPIADALDRQIAKTLKWLRKPAADFERYCVQDFGLVPPVAVLLIDGARMVSIESTAAAVQIKQISEGAAWIILAGDAPGASASVLLDFEAGTTAVLPIRRGLVGRVKLIEGLVQSLSFEPCQPLSSELGDNEMLARVRMLLEEAARQGSLARLGPLLGARLPDATAPFERIDPVLGILAAYAYELNGMETQNVDLAAQLRASGGSVPFDVSMLAGEMAPEANVRPEGIFGTLPLLALGWSVAEGTGALDRLPAVVRAIAPARLNALWTTLRADHAAMPAFRLAFQRGEIS
jgi:hypothetical protein